MTNVKRKQQKLKEKKTKEKKSKTHTKYAKIVNDF